MIQVCIRRVCFRYNIKILAMFVIPEHVHLVVKTPMNVNPSDIVQLLKGGSAFYFSNFMKKPD